MVPKAAPVRAPHTLHVASSQADTGVFHSTWLDITFLFISSDVASFGVGRFNETSKVGYCLSIIFESH